MINEKIYDMNERHSIRKAIDDRARNENKTFRDKMNEYELNKKRRKQNYELQRDILIGTISGLISGLIVFLLTQIHQ